jgi:hypothetical protein
MGSPVFFFCFFGFGELKLKNVCKKLCNYLINYFPNLLVYLPTHGHCVSNGHIATQCPGEGDLICIMLGSVYFSQPITCSGPRFRGCAPLTCDFCNRHFMYEFDSANILDLKIILMYFNFHKDTSETRLCLTIKRELRVVLKSRNLMFVQNVR